MKRSLLAITLLLLLLPAGAVQAAPATTQQSCWDQTTTRGLDSNRILRDLGLTPDLVRAVRSRLSQYGGLRGFTLDGLELTAEQISEIKRRIAVQVAEMNRYPLGWPCKPFTNQARVVKFLRTTLIYNRFRPSTTFRLPSTRQIQFSAIQDGQQYWGTVAKTGPRQIKMSLTCTQSCTTGGTVVFNLKFDA